MAELLSQMDDNSLFRSPCDPVIYQLMFSHGMGRFSQLVDDFIIQESFLIDNNPLFSAFVSPFHLRVTPRRNQAVITDTYFCLKNQNHKRISHCCCQREKHFTTNFNFIERFLLIKLPRNFWKWDC